MCTILTRPLERKMANKRRKKNKTALKKYQRGKPLKKPRAFLLQDFAVKRSDYARKRRSRKEVSNVRRKLPRPKVPSIRFLRNIRQVDRMSPEIYSRSIRSIRKRQTMDTGKIVHDTVCSIRKQRRQSLFAKKRIGKGTTITNKRRYTYRSLVKC